MGLKEHYVGIKWSLCSGCRLLGPVPDLLDVD